MTAQEDSQSHGPTNVGQPGRETEPSSGKPDPATGSSKRGCRYWRDLGLFTLGTVIVAALFLQYVGHPYFLSRGWSHPNSPAVCCQTPADHGLDYQEVSFATSDGLVLHGWYVPSQTGAAIVLAHALGSNRIGSLQTAEMLSSNGYGVLLFDLRAHGDSDGDVLPYGGMEAADVIAGANYLLDAAGIEAGRIGAMGLSLGAQVSVLAAAQSELIQAVVADGPCRTTFEDMPAPESGRDWLYVPYDLVFFSMLRWHTKVPDPLSVQEATGRLAPRPLLLIGGEGDRRLVEHHYRAAGEPKSMWIVSGADHIGGLKLRPEEYERRVVEFFDSALLP